MILVLGAGKNQRIDGAMHHDRNRFPGIDLTFDLNEHWPMDFNVCEKIIATHVVEHLKDLVNFMDQAHDVLKVDGVLEIETPNAGMNPDLTHCDPTHVRCYRPFTFHNYFTPYGIEKFGYTDKAWNIIEVKTVKLEVDDDVIIAKLSPIK
jgi:SAM-dependent methyltransferase